MTKPMLAGALFLVVLQVSLGIYVLVRSVPKLRATRLVDEERTTRLTPRLTHTFAYYGPKEDPVAAQNARTGIASGTALVLGGLALLGLTAYVYPGNILDALLSQGWN